MVDSLVPEREASATFFGKRFAAARGDGLYQHLSFALWCNGNTAPFGGGIHGSSPCGAATLFQFRGRFFTGKCRGGEPVVGFEPTTCRLRSECSTTELYRRFSRIGERGIYGSDRGFVKDACRHADGFADLPRADRERVGYAGTRPGFWGFRFRTMARVVKASSRTTKPAAYSKPPLPKP